MAFGISASLIVGNGEYRPKTNSDRLSAEIDVIFMEIPQKDRTKVSESANLESSGTPAREPLWVKTENGLSCLYGTEKEMFYMANLRVHRQGSADEFDGGGEALRSLTATASTADRIEAILELLEVEELAAALDVTAATIRNWLSGQAAPRRPALRTLDDLRRAIVILGEAKIHGEDCAQWLRSRQGGALENDRPLDVIGNDPLRVLAAATGTVLRAQEKESGDLKVVPE